MSYALNSYLRTHRKRKCLSQEELAYLLGFSSPAKVSRHEMLRRHPDLQTAFGCQVLFDAPAHEVFPGFYAKVEQTVIIRAQSLHEKLESGFKSARTMHKIEFLNALLSRSDTAH